MLFRSKLFFIVILLLAGACTVSVADPTRGFSLAPAEACDVPCWRGIRPGDTTVAEAQARLQSLYGEQAVAREGDFLRWTVSEGVTGRAALVEGRVGALTFELARGSLTVEQLLAQMGWPAEVQVSLPHPPGGAGQAERQCEVLRLRYPEQQMEATLYESRTGMVLAGQSVARLYLAPARPALSMMTPFYGREWTDYGNYCVTVDEFIEE